MNMVSLKINGYDNSSEIMVVKNIIVNIFNIKTIEDTGFNNNDITRIKFVDGSDLFVINSKEEIMELFNS